MTFIEELRWRGMIQDIMPGTEEQLKKELTIGYVGFDPTGESLHIGHLVPILLLVHLQRAGHKPVALVGGATGMIGDPSGKSQERNLLGEEQLSKNVAGIRRQLEKFLDFNSSGANAAEMVNNYDWFKEMSFIDFLRDVGKHITINYMMSKDSVKKRIEGEVGLSYTEFAYQLLQGYDFYWLHKHKGLKLQMGGSDQWGNITTGTELVRRMAGGEAFAFTCPLITKADGGKFGKTESGNVWIDPNLTTPYQFYQFWLNASDADAERWIKIFTFVSREEIEGLIEQHKKDPGARLLQKKLAEELTVFVHSRENLDSALATTAKIFENQNKSAGEMSVEDLESLEGIVKTEFAKARILEGVDVVSFLAETNIYTSKGEAKKAIIGGGVSINRVKIQQPQQVIDASQLLHGEYLLVQKGKKNYFLVKVM